LPLATVFFDCQGQKHIKSPLADQVEIGYRFPQPGASGVFAGRWRDNRNTASWQVPFYGRAEVCPGVMIRICLC
jgi:hypothetical protein